jgi:hypothetical protein
MRAFVGVSGTIVQGPFPAVEPVLAIIKRLFSRVDETIAQISAFFPVVGDSVAIVGNPVALVGDRVPPVGARLAVVRVLPFHATSLSYDVNERMMPDCSTPCSGQRVPDRARRRTGAPVDDVALSRQAEGSLQ